MATDLAPAERRSAMLANSNTSRTAYKDARDSLSMTGNSDTLIGPSSGSEPDSTQEHQEPAAHEQMTGGDVAVIPAPRAATVSPLLLQQQPRFKSTSFSVDMLSKTQTWDDVQRKLASSPRRSSAMAATTASTERHGYNETGTIMIPSAYEKTELVKKPEVRSRRQSKTQSQAARVSRHRFTKSSSFGLTKEQHRKHPSEKYVIPGEKVVEGHHNYVLAYNMITGIRVAVSRCSQLPKPLTDQDYSKVSKMVFHWGGSSDTPSTKYEFKFKDYAPEVFRDLRSVFNIDQADYLLSLTDKVALTELGSPGKSGSFFYYSGDYRFIIKTIHPAEHRHLRKILKQYHDYVVDNPDTLLCQFYGLHRLKMHTKGGIVKLHIIVMNNIFPPTREIHERYDLKGSTYGRYTDVTKAKLQGKTSLCLKDLNFLKQNQKIHLAPARKDAVLTQIRKDVDFMERTNLMDYSLLLGVHKMTDDELSAPLDEEPEFFSTRDPEKSSIFALADGGIRAADDDGNELPIIYYLAIIDCLTNYSTIKRLETLFRGLKHGRSVISAVPPSEYGERFYSFMKDAMETGKRAVHKLPKKFKGE